MDIVGFFIFYMMIVLRSGLLIDITMMSLVVVNAFFLMSFRKQQIYLTRKYNIQAQGNFLLANMIPQKRQWKQRRTLPQQQDPYDPPEYKDKGGGQEW